MPTQEEIKEMKKRFHEEYKHNFMAQGISSFLGVLIAFIASINYFGWYGFYVLYILFLIYIFVMLFRAQIKRYLKKRKIIHSDQYQYHN